MTRRGEFRIIQDLFAPLATAPGALALRDDAALVTPSPHHDLVVTTDTVIADVHFRSDDPPDDVARKALRVNLSDLAAKGARPIGILHAITLGAETDDAYLERYARGLSEDLTTFGVALLGGDTTAHRPAAVDGQGAPLTVTITAFGEVPHGRALLRSGAKPGDLVCVSGTIGDAAIGLRALTGALQPLVADHRAYLVRRYRRPEPRLALGLRLRRGATAAADVSDGLCADLGHICDASGVAAEIFWHAIPRSRAVDRRIADDPALRDLVLGGGDDYEIAFTWPADRRQELTAISTETATPITVIGAMRDISGARAKGVTVIGDYGQVIPVAQPGYVHG
jgi:thiamine-monophosphate kinase